MNWFDAQHPQQVTLKTYTGLVGKAPTKSKRIRMTFTIDLTAGDVQGCPEWLTEARDFTMRTMQTVTEARTAPGLNVVFGDPNLFKKNPVEAPKSDLRKFVVFSVGDSEKPSTLLSFVMYAPFSTDLNRWCGQMNGETFTATFDSAVPAQNTERTLVLAAPATKDEGAEDEESEDPSDGDEEYEAERREACDPKHDAEFGVASKIDDHLKKEKKGKALKNPTPREVADAKQKLTLM